MKRIGVVIALVWIGFWAGSSGACAAGLGDQVVVVFNTRVPESRDVAEHYADRRQVPSDQVIGLDLPDDEVISRSDYRNLLEKPLLQILQAKKLLRYGSQLERTANGGMRRVHGVVLAAKIRYLVLCYGVPLKIDADPL